MEEEKYGMIKMTDRIGLTNGLPVEIFIDELKRNKLNKNIVFKSFKTQEDDGSFHKILSFTYYKIN
jgi:hypothetical protein